MFQNIWLKHRIVFIIPIALYFHGTHNINHAYEISDTYGNSATYDTSATNSSYAIYATDDSCDTYDL